MREAFSSLDYFTLQVIFLAHHRLKLVIDGAQHHGNAHLSIGPQLYLYV